jgi:starch synthase
MDLRKKNKEALQDRVGLTITDEVPLLGMVTRLDHQKGIDLALEALEDVIDEGWQFVLLGSGDPKLEQATQAFAGTFRNRTRVFHRFDPELARWIYGGSDLLLIPSRYEPCGLTQMIAMRYGSVPLVRATGGLKDTVISYAQNDVGTGFLFEEPIPSAMVDALRTAFDVFTNKEAWTTLQQRGMLSDFSWRRSAERYVDLYQQAIQEKSGMNEV